MAPVKKQRPYQSRLRAEQAQQTRLRILEASGQLFAERGYAGTTIESVAERASVAIDTVYATFGAKRRLLSALIDLRLTGSADGQPVLDGEGPRAVWQEPDQTRQIAMFAADIVPRLERVRPIDDIIRGAAEVDPEIADLRRQMQEDRFRNLTTFVGWLAANGELRHGIGLDQAAAIVWTLASPEVNRLLRDVRGWSVERYAAWLGDTLVRALLP